MTQNAGAKVKPQEPNEGNVSGVQTGVQDKTVSSPEVNIDAPEPVIADDHKGQLPGDGGSQWYLDNNELHIGSGNVSTPSFDKGDGWSNYNYADDINSVVFDEGSVAGESLANYFSHLTNLKTVDFSKLDISKTSDFSSMFAYTNNLGDIDLTVLNTPVKKDLSDMFNASGVTSVNLSGANLNDSVLQNLFFKTDKLKNINFSNVLANNVNGTWMINTANSLTNLDVSNFYFTGTKTQILLDLPSLETLTVNKDMSLSLDSPYLPYKGFESENGQYQFTTAELDGVYGENGSTNPGARLTTTWKTIPKVNVNYTIHYLYTDSDGVDHKVADKTGSVQEGKLISLIPDFKGYTLSENEPQTIQTQEYGLDTTDDQTLSRDVYLMRLPVQNLTVTEENQDGTPVKGSKSQSLDWISDDKDSNNKKLLTLEGNLATNKTLDLDNTYVEIPFGDDNGQSYTGKLSDTIAFPNGMNLTISQILQNVYSKDPNDPMPPLPDTTTATDLINKVVEIFPIYENGLIKNRNYVIKLVYKAKASTGHSSSSTSDNNETITTVEDNKTVATTTKPVLLFDQTGKQITNRVLGIDSSWFSDEESTIDGVMYYRVATNEFAKASDVYVYIAQDPTFVRVYNDHRGDLIDYTGLASSRSLQMSSQWKTDRIALIDGKQYYRVATNEFVPVGEVYEYTNTQQNITTETPVMVYNERGQQLDVMLTGTYKTDMIATINNQPYYRVATNEFVKVIDVE